MREILQTMEGLRHETLSPHRGKGSRVRGAVGRYEQPIVLPRVTHPTCCFKDVSRAHIGAILPVLLSARNAPCEPSDNVRPPRSDRDR